MNSDFYGRTMVVRLQDIFCNPHKPQTFNQEQFDMAQEDLVKTASKDWHQIDQSDYWHYLLDLCYVDLDQKLFDYLFPAFLIRWWEGLLDRTGGPESECDFYKAIDRGEVLTKMINEPRRQRVLSWMVDAYMEGVDHWGGCLTTSYEGCDRPANLNGPVSYFNAIGQSVPITAQILKTLIDVSTTGRAQWWLVFGTGLAWNENLCPFVPAWTPTEGGGGIYLTTTATAIFDHGYLPENHQPLVDQLTFESLMQSLAGAKDLLCSTVHANWLAETIGVFECDPERIRKRLRRYFELMRLPNLGGFAINPLEIDT